jgi:predicted SAM-dependent methyltransferase
VEAHKYGSIHLNIGSGQRPFKPPFYNTDIQNRWKEPTEKAGCWWIDSSCAYSGWSAPVEMIVLHHVLEHFGCGEADALVGECHQMLEPGGSLIVCVPNIRELSRAWVTGRMDTQLYMTNLYGAYMGEEEDRHKWGYDPQSLEEYLKRWDWAVKKFDFRPIEGADIAKDWYILGMECVK